MKITFVPRQLDIRGGHNLSVTQVSAHVMADLQQHHTKELERILLEMQHKVCDLTLWGYSFIQIV